MLWQTVLVTTSAVVVLACAGMAQPAPLKKEAIVLRVTQENITESGTNWRKSWGGFSRDFGNQRILIVGARILGPFDPRVTLHWCFVGRDATTKNLVTFGDGEKAVVIRNGGSEFVLMSQSVRSNIARENTPRRSGTGTTWTGQTFDVEIHTPSAPIKRTGIKPHGWCLFIAQNGRIVAETANVPEMIEWGRKHLGLVRP